MTLSFQGNYFLTWAFLVADPARLVDSGIETVREEVLETSDFDSGRHATLLLPVNDLAHAMEDE